MYSILLLILIAVLIAYGALFVRYHEAIAYYGEERVGFHKWIVSFLTNLWRRNKL